MGFGLRWLLNRLVGLDPGEPLTWARVEDGIGGFVLRNFPGYVIGSPALLLLVMVCGGFALGLAIVGVAFAALLLAELLTGGL